MKKLIEPLKIDSSLHKKEWVGQGLLHSRDGVKTDNNQGWSIIWEMAKPFVKNYRNAVDIGARDCETSFYYHQLFDHTYCFDMNGGPYIGYNIDTTKVTYFLTALGDKNEVGYSRGATIKTTHKNSSLNEKIIRIFDDFEIEDVDFMKVDVEGFEYKVLKGAEKTIKKYFPVIVIEQNDQTFDDETGTHLDKSNRSFEATEYLKSLGYNNPDEDMYKANYVFVKNV